MNQDQQPIATPLVDDLDKTVQGQNWGYKDMRSLARTLERELAVVKSVSTHNSEQAALFESRLREQVQSLQSELKERTESCEALASSRSVWMSKYESLQSERDKLQKENEELKSHEQELRNCWTEERNDHNKVREELSKLQQEIERINGVLRFSESRILSLEEERDTLQAQLRIEQSLPSQLLDVHALCEQRDSAVSERDKLRKAVLWFEGYFETNIYGGGIPHCPWCYKRTDDEGKWQTIPHTDDCLIGHALNHSKSTTQ